MFPGAIFGVMVSGYCAISLRIRSWARLLSFVAASIVAYFLAVVLGVYAVVRFRPWEWLSREWSFESAMFLSSMLGAWLILTAAQILFCTWRGWKAILSAALGWALTGGVLGVVGWSLGASVGKLLWLALHAIHLTMTDANLQGAVSNKTVNFFSLFTVWQTCMAPVLGWLLCKRSAAAPERQSAASSA